MHACIYSIILMKLRTIAESCVEREPKWCRIGNLTRLIPTLAICVTYTSIAQIKTCFRRYKSDQWTTVVAVVAQDERGGRKTEEQVAGRFAAK